MKPAMTAPREGGRCSADRSDRTQLLLVRRRGAYYACVRAVTSIGSPMECAGAWVSTYEMLPRRRRPWARDRGDDPSPGPHARREVSRPSTTPSLCDRRAAEDGEQLVAVGERVGGAVDGRTTAVPAAEESPWDSRSEGAAVTSARRISPPVEVRSGPAGAESSSRRARVDRNSPASRLCAADVNGPRATRATRSARSCSDLEVASYETRVARNVQSFQCGCTSHRRPFSITSGVDQVEHMYVSPDTPRHAAARVRSPK